MAAHHCNPTLEGYPTLNSCSERRFYFAPIAVKLAELAAVRNGLNCQAAVKRFGHM